MKTKAILFLLAGVLIAADRPLYCDLSTVTAEPSLDGQWQCVWRNGKDPRGTQNAIHYIFRANELKMEAGVKVQGTIRVDTSKHPWTMDMTYGGSTYDCIFEQVGDDLVISWSRGQLPPDFDESKGSVMKFKRLK